MLGSLVALVACVHLPFISANPGVVQEISLLEHNNSPLLLYPTQFTQNIVPKQIHSHNDCDYFRLSRSCYQSIYPASLDWRDVPLLSAISLGVSSVEADVWLVDGELLVCYYSGLIDPYKY